MNPLWTGLMVGSAVALAGCEEKPLAPPPSPFNVSGLPTQAQAPLPTTKLYLGAEELVAEVATQPRQHQTGMMFRTNLAENAGMLFVFPFPHQAGFWMMNTPLPLSAAYIDDEGTILEIHDLQPHNTNSVVAQSDRIRYVLEVNQGWFNRHNLSTGTLIRTDRGSFRETWFGGR